MKTGVKTLQDSDYQEIVAEVEQLNWLMREFRYQVPTARIDAPDTIGHPHRMWEWGRALHAIKEVFGEAKVSVLDIGSAYSLLGPSLSYLGYSVTEIDPDYSYLDDRRKINSFLSSAKFKTINWERIGFGPLFSQVGQFDVVISISTVEHIPLDLEKTCWKEMSDATKSNGLLVVTLDCMPEERKGFQNDSARYTNYSMNTVKQRVDELKSYGFKSLGTEDYTYYGPQVYDYTFASIIMTKTDDGIHPYVTKDVEIHTPEKKTKLKKASK